MSFGDISKSWTPSAVPAAVSSDDISQISGSLQAIQRVCISIKESLTSMRRRKVGPSEKHEFDLRIKDLKESETNLKAMLDALATKIDSLPRSEASSKRATLSKLQKDYDKVVVNIQAILNESTLIKVVNERGELETASPPRIGTRLASGAPSGVITSKGSSIQSSTQPTSSSTSTYDSSTSSGIAAKNNQKQQIVLRPLLTGKEVDDAILEERERDIRKMNHDLQLVNEMFKDMAQLVDNQGIKVNEIAKSTDASHDRAKAGLEQVNRAAESQPVCSLC